MHRLLLLLLVPALAACDARQFDGPDDAEDPAAARLTAQVRYRLEGSYATCKIVHTDPADGLVTRYEVPLPWTKTFEVTVDEKTGPFDASVEATCLDPEKSGKSTLALYVDGFEKRRDTAAGPGATAEVHFRVGADE